MRGPLHQIPPPVVVEEWVDVDKKVVRVELEEGDTVESISKDSEPEQVLGLSVSKAQRVLVQSPSEMVRSDFRLSSAE